MNTVGFDIKKDGAKIWKEIHEKAFRARTEKQKEEYDSFIIKLQQDFSCLDCREHFGNYINEDPPWNYRDFRDKHGDDIGYFYWSWKFHDRVNERLKKQRYTFKKSYEYYKKNICLKPDEEKLIAALRIIEDYNAGRIKGHPL